MKELYRILFHGGLWIVQKFAIYILISGGFWTVYQYIGGDWLLIPIILFLIFALVAFIDMMINLK